MTRQVKIQFANFDFNKTDMGFINHQIGANYGPKTRPVIDALRVWLADRSYGQTTDICYQGAVMSERGHVTALEEAAFIIVDGVEVVHLHIERSLTEATAALALTDQEAEVRNANILAVFDQRSKEMNTRCGGAYRHINYSLRPLLKSVLKHSTHTLALGVEVYGALFAIREGDFTYTIKLVLKC